MSKSGNNLIISLILSIAAIAGSAQPAVVNVDCKDTVSDAARLNDAISDSKPGSYISIHGHCLVNETIVLYGDRTYAGDSRTGTVIKQARGANLAALVASDSWKFDSSTTGLPVRIAHLTLDGDASNNIETNVLVIRSWLTVIEDVVVQNAPGDGIQITNLSKNGTALQNTQVNGRISNCFVTNSGGNGIHVVDTGNSVTDWDLLDCWIASSGQSGITMDNAAGWKIRGNHLYGVPQNAIYANRCFGTAIEGNYIEDFGDSGGSGNTWYGIACTAQGDVASVINANKIFMFNTEPSTGKFVYIGIPQVNYDVGQVGVVGNTILGSGSARDIGLSYQLGAGKGLEIVSASNNVRSVAKARVVGPGVTLVPGY